MPRPWGPAGCFSCGSKQLAPDHPAEGNSQATEVPLPPRELRANELRPLNCLAGLDPPAPRLGAQRNHPGKEMLSSPPPALIPGAVLLQESALAGQSGQKGSPKPPPPAAAGESQLLPGRRLERAGGCSLGLGAKTIAHERAVVSSRQDRRRPLAADLRPRQTGRQTDSQPARGGRLRPTGEAKGDAEGREAALAGEAARQEEAGGGRTLPRAVRALWERRAAALHQAPRGAARGRRQPGEQR